MQNQANLIPKLAAYAITGALLAGAFLLRERIEAQWREWLRDAPSHARAQREPPPPPPGPPPLPELPAHLGRIQGRIVLAGERLRAVAAGRMPCWKTAVFIEEVPEDLWRVARADEPPPAKLSSVLIARYGSDHRLYSRNVLVYDPPILLCRPGDSFRLILRDVDPKNLAFNQFHRGYPVWRYEQFTTNPNGIGSTSGSELWTGSYNAGAAHRMDGDDGSDGVGEQGSSVRTAALPWMRMPGYGGIDVFQHKWGEVEPFIAIGVQNPYHALVDPAGDSTFVFDRIPPGVYWLRTFDPFFETVRRPVRVRAGEVAEIDLVVDQRQFLRFYRPFYRPPLTWNDPLPEEQVADDMVSGPGLPLSSVAKGIPTGAIEGRIVLGDPELSTIARERPAVYVTAVYLENVDLDTWELAPAYPPSKPLDLELTREHAGKPHVEEGANWVYRPGVVQVVGFRDCLRLREPKEYGGHQRLRLRMVSVEIFDPAGDRVFMGRRDLSFCERYDDAIQQSRGRSWSVLDPFLTHPLQRTLGEANRLEKRAPRDLEYPLLRSQGWGRVECLYRPRTSREFETNVQEGVMGEENRGDQAPLYVVGVQNPYHMLIDLHGDGTFRIDGVPAGTHWLRTFDAHFATARLEVRVEPGEVTRLEIVLAGRRE